jgi:phage regulator Rha-like protein
MEEDELAKEDQRFIKAWLRMTERTIKTAKKEAQQHSNSRKLMESFIQWRPSSKTRRRTASELQPD